MYNEYLKMHRTNKAEEWDSNKKWDKKVNKENRDATRKEISKKMSSTN